MQARALNPWEELMRLRPWRTKRITKIGHIGGVFRGKVRFLHDVKPKRPRRRSRPPGMTEHQTIRWLRKYMCKVEPKPTGELYKDLKGPCLIVDSNTNGRCPVTMFKNERGKNYCLMTPVLSLAESMGKPYAEIAATGLETCHGCDRPMCIQPLHLRLDTHKANMQDASKRGRAGRKANKR